MSDSKRLEFGSRGSPLNIVIVGGSLGGLFAGIALKRLGHSVRILERSPDAVLHDQGAGIVARDHTQEYLERYDRTRTPATVSSGVRQWLDGTGVVARTAEVEQKMTSWDVLYRLLRANFDGVSLGGITPPETRPGEGKAIYDYGHVVTGLELNQADNTVEVSYLVGETREKQVTTADLVIGADGASSTVRRLFEPTVERRYAGYVAWRGTLLEEKATQLVKDTFPGRSTFFHAPELQVLVYLIPGRDGSLEPGKRLINWVWYVNYEADSEALNELMTDVNGKRHNLSLPVGAMQLKVWEKQKLLAEKLLPPSLVQLVQATTLPFIQCITDMISPRNCFMNGHVFLIGDATAGLRPHPAASTSRAAFDVMLLVRVLKGEVPLEEWQAETLKDAREFQELSVRLGQKSQFENHSLDELMKR